MPAFLFLFSYCSHAQVFWITLAVFSHAQVLGDNTCCSHAQVLGDNTCCSHSQVLGDNTCCSHAQVLGDNTCCSHAQVLGGQHLLFSCTSVGGQHLLFSCTSVGDNTCCYPPHLDGGMGNSHAQVLGTTLAVLTHKCWEQEALLHIFYYLTKSSLLFHALEQNEELWKPSDIKLKSKIRKSMIICGL